MPKQNDTICPKLKKEYEELLKMKRGFEVVFNDGLPMNNLERAKEMKIEIEKALDALNGLLKEEIFISPEIAKRIMGSDYFGPEAVEEAFGFKMDDKDIPAIPFNKWELKKAKELGQFLILRGYGIRRDISSVFKNVFFHFNIKNMIDIFQNRFKDEGNIGRDTPNSIGHNERNFYCCHNKWALVSKEIMPDSSNKDYLDQTAAIIKYLKEEVFKGKELPQQYQEAVDDFKKQEASIRKLIEDKDYLSARYGIDDLAINELARQDPAEFVYDFLVFFAHTGKKMAVSKSAWTAGCASFNFVIAGGRKDEDIIDLNKKEINFKDKKVGVLFARKL